jgi:hypothetical protein
MKVVENFTTIGTSSLPSLVLAGCMSIGLSYAFSFVFGVEMVPAINFYWIFFVFTELRNFILGYSCLL